MDKWRRARAGQQGVTLVAGRAMAGGAAHRAVAARPAVRLVVAAVVPEAPVLAGAAGGPVVRLAERTGVAPVVRPVADMEAVPAAPVAVAIAATAAPQGAALRVAVALVVAALLAAWTPATVGAVRVRVPVPVVPRRPAAPTGDLAALVVTQVRRDAAMPVMAAVVIPGTAGAVIPGTAGAVIPGMAGAGPREPAVRTGVAARRIGAGREAQPARHTAAAALRVPRAARALLGAEPPARSDG